MENWEVMAQAMPRGEAEKVAAGMRKRGYKCTHDEAIRWRRPQTSDETPEATGHASPLDRVTDLIEVMVVDDNRSGASLVVNQVNARYHRLVYPNSQFLTLNDQPEINRAGAQLLQESAQAVSSLTGNGVTRETVYALVKLQQRVGEILACANQDLLRAESGGGGVDRVVRLQDAGTPIGAAR